MPFKNKLKNQRGMTLIELLAAITILGVVFIGFVSIFPQMTKFNVQTEEKLGTMNLARLELVELKEGLKTLNPANKEDSSSSDEIITYKYNQSGYQYEVEYYKTPDLPKNEHAGSVELNKIHIKVKKDEKMISETFGYLKDSNLQ
ncbi:hypothetical protein CWR48_16975 [Oceanobacillus arenosus]|uniref:Prepilin-type cleavage/methylation domain-containing protein n=1 Tax=Oceanobacillus arenosus TaxID=1229153 RepID=A0A3D8PLG9_9BACI|nr:type II secretion system protein [Oceanobacillus arenosus]RDW16337.1 hypothetical protein CWR48_16975 [Oceanobacillus arenosus]